MTGEGLRMTAKCGMTRNGLSMTLPTLLTNMKK